MYRGWIVILKDGTELNELTTTWKQVPKKDISCLSLLFDGRRWDLKNKEAYFISNRGSMVPGIDASFQVEARTIGFYEGATKVSYTIIEDTGVFSINIKENK